MKFIEKPSSVDVLSSITFIFLISNDIDTTSLTCLLF